MQRRKTWVFGIAVLAAVWALAVSVMGLARARRMTPEKIAAYTEQRSLPEMSAHERKSFVEGLARRMNRLDYEGRRRFRLQRTLHDVFAQMTDEERLRYLDLTLPNGFKKMMEAFNEMPRKERTKLVHRAVRDLEEAAGAIDQDRPREWTAFSEEATQKIVDEGLRAYMLEASASSKVDLQPLIEQMQSILQTLR